MTGFLKVGVNISYQNTNIDDMTKIILWSISSMLIPNLLQDCPHLTYKYIQYYFDPLSLMSSDRKVFFPYRRLPKKFR